MDSYLQVEARIVKDSRLMEIRFMSGRDEAIHRFQLSSNGIYEVKYQSIREMFTAAVV